MPGQRRKRRGRLRRRTRRSGRLAQPPSHTGCALTLAALLHSCRTNAPERVRNLLLSSTFHLQNEVSWEWAMLGWNQRPLPCKGGFITSRLSAGVRKLLQISIFPLPNCRTRSPLFTWVGVIDQGFGTWATERNCPKRVQATLQVWILRVRSAQSLKGALTQKNALGVTIRHNASVGNGRRRRGHGSRCCK